MNYYERHLGDYAKDAGHLTALQHGIYGLLIDWYYANERPIPDDMAHRIGRSPRKEVEIVLKDFFILTGDSWTHRRVDRELVKYQERAERNRTNGKRGGRPNITHKEPSGLLEETDIKPKATLSQKPVTSKEQELYPELPATPDEKPSLADPIFGTGLDFLLRKGLPEKSARSFLGLLRKELRDDLTVAELLVEAERQDVCAPQAWLSAAAKERKRQGNPRAGPAGPTSKAGQAIQALEAMKHGHAQLDPFANATAVDLGLAGPAGG